eukprot:GHVQ01036260.1.p1 GENE.GHVQ01036260.1~~GHVQ01036260.1.p1  ORF type:complete len:236 (-),score=43.11 GHVQ01036260.1:229-936(-)
MLCTALCIGFSSVYFLLLGDIIMLCSVMVLCLMPFLCLTSFVWLSCVVLCLSDSFSCLKAVLYLTFLLAVFWLSCCCDLLSFVALNPVPALAGAVESILKTLAVQSKKQCSLKQREAAEGSEEGGGKGGDEEDDDSEQELEEEQDAFTDSRAKDILQKLQDDWQSDSDDSDLDFDDTDESDLRLRPVDEAKEFERLREVLTGFPPETRTEMNKMLGESHTVLLEQALETAAKEGY